MKAATNITNIKDYNLAVENDGKLSISTGNSRFETHWKNKKMLWSALLARLEKSQTTGETHAEYMKMGKEQQDRIKDIGGFVGGHLKDGRRKTGYVATRQIVTLDLDFAPADFWDQLMNNLTINGAMAVYSTHKHSPKTPRFRLIIPLDRDVTPDEYEAIARKLAEKVGMDWFDPTTFQPTRLMYWPSNSADVEPFFMYYDAPFMSADELLQEYPDWTDVSYWPMAKGEIDRRRPGSKQQDPLSKKGIVGLFCRTYSVTQAIEKFLSDVYEQTTGKDDRYTYKAGSTSAGVVIYDNDTFAYSNHSTDPASNQACNAFDLVRIHLFGDQDDDAMDKSGAQRPSYKAMAEFAANDPLVSSLAAQEQQAKAAEDFRPIEEDEDWRTRLTKNENGRIIPEANNAMLILTFDEHLQGIRFNEMSGRIEATGLPWSRPDKIWRDADDAQLYMWVARNHGVQFPENKFAKALVTVADNRRFHPIREYLDNLPEWDGVERLDTLLIDLFGASDSLYVREVTRKCMTAAVARIYKPGVKFDSVLVLDGPQGIGKSTFFRKLAGDWFSDSLSLTDMRDKTGAELVQGHWIMELGEMAGMKKADIEVVKSFVSRQDDIYRAAYGRNVESHKRQCIIVGSTNAEAGFLRDITGNRRFWPVKVTGHCKRKPWDLTAEEVAQIWAETKVNYELGEDLFLIGEAARAAEEAQRDAMEADDRQGIVEEYLEKLLPENWDSLDLDSRLMFLNDDTGVVKGTVKRTTVTNIEIWVEALGNRMRDMKPMDSTAIAAMMVRIPGWERTNKRVRIPLYGQQRLYKRCDT